MAELGKLPPVEFDVYLVPRVQGRRPAVGEFAAHVGTVTVDPRAVPAATTPLNHAIELIAAWKPDGVEP